jgi:hypothetical protein
MISRCAFRALPFHALPLYVLPRAMRFAAVFAVVVLGAWRCAGAAPEAVSSAADPDFAVQGEYAGEIQTGDGPKAIGVQVVALGGGKFHAVAYTGGLPGAGYDKGELHESDGETQDGVTVFKGEAHEGRIKDGVLTITSAAPDNLRIGEFNKTLRKSPTERAAPPAGAIVLFDGSAANDFDPGKASPEGLLTQGQTSKHKFQSGTLHIEFQTPFMPASRGQKRGNSGVYLQGRYETQVLDSFGLKGANNECGGIYEIAAPTVNMCYPPLSWQTYDIDFTAARYEDGKKAADATITVRHNGVLVQDKIALPRKTRAAPGNESSEPGPLYLQNHGNPVNYRNIWFVEAK